MKILAVALALLLMAAAAIAHSDGDFEKAEEIIAGKAPCSELTEQQLELIGEYYMEQMHPGEEHEAMDELMGGEGSETLRLMHMRMAQSFYCGDRTAMSSGMMNMMMGRNGGMMGASSIKGSGGMNNMMQGVMGSWGYGYGYGNFVNVLYVMLLVGLIILVYLWAIKMWRGLSKKKR
ncbi:hypothetical protein J4470_01635 [Candidatus Woesearchaeota archaeon]|nr:hypothetical protein [Candidatus Woesearchaeota archaeon]